MTEIQLNAQISMRLMEQRHAEALFEFIESGREKFQQWIPYVSKTKTLEAAVSLVSRFLDMHQNETGYVYGLWDGDKMVGNVLIKDIDPVSQRAEIGYMAARAYQRRGLAHAACTHMIEFFE